MLTRLVSITFLSEGFSGSGALMPANRDGSAPLLQVQDIRDILSALDIPRDRDTRHALDIPRRRHGPEKYSRSSRAG
jgi:hypothetical protein